MPMTSLSANKILSLKLVRPLVAVLALAALMTSCHSSRIISKGTDSSMLSNKKALVEALKQAEQNNAVKTYLTKNSSAKLSTADNNYTLRVQLYMDYGKQTNLIGKLPFPPIVIGELELTGDFVKVRSKTLNFYKEQKLHYDANLFIQPALLGRVPPFYRIFGKNDFSDFEVFITDDNLYCLSYKDTQIGVQILVTKNFLLSEYTLSDNGNTLHQSNSDFLTVDGLYLPTTINFDLVTPSPKTSGSAVLNLSKIQINGSEKLNF